MKGAGPSPSCCCCAFSLGALRRPCCGLAPTSAVPAKVPCKCRCVVSSSAFLPCATCTSVLPQQQALAVARAAAVSSKHTRQRGKRNERNEAENGASGPAKAPPPVESQTGLFRHFCPGLHQLPSRQPSPRTSAAVCPCEVDAALVEQGRPSPQPSRRGGKEDTSGAASEAGSAHSKDRM